MTDQQIEDAYGRLNDALAPPADVAVRVERRIRGRRTRRRVGVAGLAGLVVAGSVGGAVLLGSGDRGNDGTTIASDPPSGSFVLTRPDGSTYEFDDLTLSCTEPPFDGLEGVPVPGPQRIWLYSQLEASDDALTKPFFYVGAIVDRADGQTFTLPVDSDSGASVDVPLTLFVGESATHGKKQANEVSSVEPGAAGSVRVLRASCDPTPVLELEADTTLGSEVRQGTLDLAGSFG